MPFRVSGKNLDIGEALRTRVNRRIAEATAKYFDGGYSGHVTISKEGFGFRTECLIHLDSGIVLEAEALSADAYSSADQAALRIEKRLRRYKRRLRDHQAFPIDGRCQRSSEQSMRQATSSRAGTGHRRGDHRVQPGHHCRKHHHVEAPVGERSGDATRSDRYRGGGVPARWTRPRQSGLSPSRRPYRLDRSTGRGRPLTDSVRLPMVRRP